MLFVDHACSGLKPNCKTIERCLFAIVDIAEVIYKLTVEFSHGIYTGSSKQYNSKCYPVYHFSVLIVTDRNSSFPDEAQKICKPSIAYYLVTAGIYYVISIQM